MGIRRHRLAFVNSNTSMRRTLIIGAVVVVLLGVGGYVYWRYFSGGPSLTVSGPSTSLPTADTAAPSDSDTGTSSGNTASLAVTKVTARLTKIAEGPVVPGEAVVTIPAANASSTSDVGVRFIERQSGNIFSYLTRAGTLTRISNKTLPGILSAKWLPNGKTAFVTYLSGDALSTVNTYGLASDGSGGFFLPTGLSGLAVSSTSVLSLASGATGSIATLSKADGVGGATVWSSPLSALRIAFVGKGYVAFTKPSQSLLGDLFLVSAGGAFSRLAGPLPGLSALPSHSGATVLVSSANGGVMRTALVDTATGVSTALPLATIADKCVWAADDQSIYCGVPVTPSPDYSYPDDWYQGAVHFSDRIWKVEVKGRFVQLVFDPTSASSVGALDAQALALDPKTTLLVFINKNDGSLWSYRL